MAIKVGLILISVFVTVVGAARAESAEVRSFSPLGTVRDIRQVRATFSEAMVPVGQPEAPTPFDIECPEHGKGRWIDPQNWIYDFDRDLPRGVNCTFRLRPSVRTLQGASLSGGGGFEFRTGEPALADMNPYEGSDITDDQVFILKFDGAVTPAEVAKNVRVAVDGIQSSLPIEILPQGELRELLSSRRFKRQAGAFGKTLFAIRAKQAFPAERTVRVSYQDGNKFEYKVRGPLRAELSCERENANAPCMPVGSVSLRFSADVPVSHLRQIRLRHPDGKEFAPTNLAKYKEGQEARSVDFPKPLEANTAFSVIMPKDIKDYSGRPLANADRFPLEFKTGVFPPLIKFSSSFGIVEAANPVLPVTVRAVEPKLRLTSFNVRSIKMGSIEDKFAFFVKKARENGWRDSASNQSIFAGTEFKDKAEASALPVPSGGKDFEVMGIPLKGPGFYVVEIESPILGQSLIAENRPYYVSTAVLVTNLSVHLKWGRERSLVWVTQLSSGKPVRDAAAMIFDCNGKKLWSGKTDASGIAYADRLPRKLENCQQGYRLIATARQGDDEAIVMDSWDQGIEPFRFNVQQRYDDGDSAGSTLAHAILSRSLLRAGETLHMKHVLRVPSAGGFRLPNASEIPAAIEIAHLGSDERYTQDLKFDASGIATNEWKVPKGAKLGTYEITYLKAKTAERRWGAPVGATFRVEEFRLPMMKAIVQGPSGPLVRAKSVPLNLGLQYMSGGPAAGEKISLRYQFSKRSSVRFADYEDYVFARPKVTEKVSRASEDEEFDGEPANETGNEAANETTDGIAEGPAKNTYRSVPLTLDRAGANHVEIKTPAKFAGPAELNVEMEYRDPSGGVDTASSRFQLWGAERVVGIMPGSWSTTKESVKVQVVVLDLKGRPQAGVPVSIDQFSNSAYSYRKKLVGGFYAYETSSEIKRIGPFCQGKTDVRGLLICEKPSVQAGEIIFQATAKDAHGAETYSNVSMFIYDRDELWFDQGNNDRIDLLTDAKSFAPGSSATFQVRMPFRQATTLVTVEREGILDAFVTELKGDKPEVKVPIKDSYSPNVYVSTLAVRGRVDEPKPTALIDLGKPAFKLGLKNIRVGWSGHELKIRTATDKPIYQTRGKAKVTVNVTPPKGWSLPKDTELAVAVVDEALLELMPNSTWDVLKAMMNERPYDVRTSTASMNVIGKRHFGKKALASGGGGGRETTRELFDTLVLWKGRVPVGANGTTSLDVPLNDSISKFRVAVIATGGAQLFGSGDTSFATTRDLQILPALPQIVREGDHLDLHATVRNTTTKPIAAKVSLVIDGVKTPFDSRALKLPAQSAQDLSWPLDVPANSTTELKFGFDVKSESTDGPSDTVKSSVRVLPATPVRTIQATLLQVAPNASIPVEKPSAALPGKGGIEVSLSPRLGASVDAVIDYMRTYPYTCLEQQVSRTVVLADKKQWDEIVQSLPSYSDSNGLLKYWPVMERGSDVLASYVLAVSHEAGFALPAERLEKIKDGLQRFVEGKIPDETPGLETKSLQLRKLAAIDALSRYGSGPISLVSTLQIQPQTWPTSAVIDWLNILHRWPKIPDRAKRLDEASRILRARLDFRGTRLGFSTESTDLWTALMISPDLNAARLMLSVLQDSSWRSDLPRLVRGAMDRRHFGVWFNTTANAWNVLALRKFSAEFEKEPVSGATKVQIGAQMKRLDWKSNPKGAGVDLAWPDKPAALSIAHEGAGQPWATVSAKTAIPLTEPSGNGFKLKREVLPIQQKSPGVWSRGDIARIRITFEAQTDNTWVAIQDPIPAGAGILGSGLGRDSALTSTGEKNSGAWPVFQERAADSFRAYYQYVAKGTSSIEYTVRFNQSGRYVMPATHIEAMYAPDVFADMPIATLEVKE